MLTKDVFFLYFFLLWKIIDLLVIDVSGYFTQFSIVIVFLKSS